ncbi:MAG: isoprenylcysteine carboxylmethyltransferase family protein [Candidatus Bathyarchaeota archaeon]|nr:isoprenylcysteine carboxylmethyltransferase family protein [Candidatus Bathyarchaeota archaeon]
MRALLIIASEEKERFKLKKSLREDWTGLSAVVALGTGFIIAILDFVFLQNKTFQVFALAGLCLLLIGGYLRFKARLDLKKKAGFSSLGSTARLQIVEGHRLLTDGLYKHVRHPIYLAETLRNFGFVLIFSSIYGVLFIGIGTILLLFRIRIEEKMLVEAFGEDYKEYQRKTKKLIPYIY